MTTKFHFSSLEMMLLVTNAVVLGGCIVLLMLGWANAPLILLTIGAFGLLLGKAIKGYNRAQRSQTRSSGGQEGGRIPEP